jgi:hypothetical protein
MVLAKKKNTWRPLEQNRSPDTNPHNYSHLIFDKAAQICIGEKITSLTKGAGKTGFPPAQD